MFYSFRLFFPFIYFSLVLSQTFIHYMHTWVPDPMADWLAYLNNPEESRFRAPGSTGKVLSSDPSLWLGFQMIKGNRISDAGPVYLEPLKPSTKPTRRKGRCVGAKRRRRQTLDLSELPL